jgi:hypothetical protein
MRISEMLNAIASWLESPDNEALLLAEYDDDCAQVVAESCVGAAQLLKIAADRVDQIEPAQESNLTDESLDQLAQIADAFDSSNDENLKKQASVIDELLLTIASPPNALAARQDLLDNRTEEIKKKYHNPTKILADSNKTADSQKAIENSKMTKQTKINEQPLNTRYCPDHAGVQVARVGEHIVQCELDHKIYDYESGYTLEDGTKVPGGDVSLQTQLSSSPFYAIFDNRDARLMTNKA